MKFKFYEYEKCSTCKKARLWLESHGLEFERIPIRDIPPNKKELAIGMQMGTALADSLWQEKFATTLFPSKSSFINHVKRSHLNQT